jgi:predicted  nucleic acid-binding Zn-ribbon protein
MTIFGLSITKKSYVTALETEIYELIDRLSSLATEIVSLKDGQDALITTHGEYEAEISALKAEIEPLKAFVAEHGKNILEAEEEFNKQQRFISDGMNNIANFDPFVKKQGDK